MGASGALLSLVRSARRGNSHGGRGGVQEGIEKLRSTGCCNCRMGIKPFWHHVLSSVSILRLERRWLPVLASRAAQSAPLLLLPVKTGEKSESCCLTRSSLQSACAHLPACYPTICGHGILIRNLITYHYAAAFIGVPFISPRRRAYQRWPICVDWIRPKTKEE